MSILENAEIMTTGDGPGLLCLACRKAGCVTLITWESTPLLLDELMASFYSHMNSNHPELTEPCYPPDDPNPTPSSIGGTILWWVNRAAAAWRINRFDEARAAAEIAEAYAEMKQSGVLREDGQYA